MCCRRTRVERLLNYPTVQLGCLETDLYYQGCGTAAIRGTEPGSNSGSTTMLGMSDSETILTRKIHDHREVTIVHPLTTGSSIFLEQTITVKIHPEELLSSDPDISGVVPGYTCNEIASE